LKYILIFLLGISIVTLNAAYGYDRSTYVENPERCYSVEFPIDWSGCNLYGKVLPDIDYRYANLSNANLAGAILSGKDLSNADLSGAFLKYAEIDNAILTNADLSNVNIIRGWGTMLDIVEDTSDEKSRRKYKNAILIKLYSLNFFLWH